MKLLGRRLGLDIGDKRIGVAMSDEMGWIASPLLTLERTTLEKDIEALSRIVSEQGIAKIVVGVPRSLSLKVTPQTQKVLDFIEIFKKHCSLSIEEWDERFSTKAAQNILIEADISRKKRKKVIDKLAAAIILQSFLDTHR